MREYRGAIFVIALFVAVVLAFTLVVRLVESHTHEGPLHTEQAP